mgnify:CR=1 FL=1
MLRRALRAAEEAALAREAAALRALSEAEAREARAVAAVAEKELQVAGLTRAAEAAAAHAAGVRILKMSPALSSLEDVFIKAVMEDQHAHS